MSGWGRAKSKQDWCLSARVACEKPYGRQGSLNRGNSGDVMDDKLTEPRKDIHVLMVGVGGCGCNTINRVIRSGLDGEFLAINTDQESLNLTHKGAKKLLIGKSVLHGTNAGGNPKIGAECAETDRAAIETELTGKQVVFVFCGIGGGTGTGAAPIIAEIAKKQGALTIVAATCPFRLERTRYARTEEAIKRFQKSSHAVILRDNNQLVKLVPNLPINEAFAAADEIVAKAIGDFLWTFSKPALINDNFEEVRDIICKEGISGSVGFIAWGEGKKEDKRKLAAEGALKNIFLDTGYDEAKCAFFHITGGPDICLGDAIGLGELITDEMPKDAISRWGARMAPGFDNKLVLSGIVLGVKVPQFEVDGKASKELFKVVRKNDLAKTRFWVLRKGVGVLARDKEGCTPLHFAVSDIGVTMFLVGQGADVNARDKSGATPLHNAAFRGKLEVAKFLLEKGADANARGPGQATPLHNAAHMSDAKVRNADYVGVAKLLIEAGADVNALNSKGYPPLHFAKKKEVIEFLKGAGGKTKG